MRRSSKRIITNLLITYWFMSVALACYTTGYWAAEFCSAGVAKQNVSSACAPNTLNYALYSIKADSPTGSDMLDSSLHWNDGLDAPAKASVTTD